MTATSYRPQQSSGAKHQPAKDLHSAGPTTIGRSWYWQKTGERKNAGATLEFSHGAALRPFERSDAALALRAASPAFQPKPRDP